MIDVTPLTPDRTFDYISKAAIAIAIAIALTVLAGWILNVAELKSVLPGMSTMKAHTALAFIFSGIAIWLLGRNPDAPNQHPGLAIRQAHDHRVSIARICAVVVLIIGLATVCEYLFGWNLGIDEFFLSISPNASLPTHPGRASPHTGVNFLLLGAALLTIDWKTRNDHWPAQWLVFLILLSTYVAIIGYAYGVQTFYKLPDATALALHTAIVFVAVAVGFLCARPNRGLLSIAKINDPAGILVRRLILAAILLFPFLGWLVLTAAQAGVYPFQFGLAILVTCAAAVFVALAYWSGISVRDYEAKLRGSNESLERSNLALQQFAYVASHDLQTPLRSIRSFVQLLEAEYKGKLDAQADDWIRRTVQSTSQMQALIHDLLEYARVESQSKPLQRLDMHDLFDKVMTLLQSSIQESGAEVRHDNLPAVLGDASQLVQLMQNLLGNAIKYHGDRPPRVHVSVRRDANEWCFSVRDNGIGIAPKHFERIFEIFSRLHSQREYPGTGIGLAICRRIVFRHGGRIWVESVPGQGSVFHFTIPEWTLSNT